LRKGLVELTLIPLKVREIRNVEFLICEMFVWFLDDNKKTEVNYILRQIQDLDFVTYTFLRHYTRLINAYQ
jgi:hypothetical protein